MDEIHCPLWLSHSHSIIVKMAVFFCSLSWDLNCKRLCPVVGSVCADFCHDTDHVRSLHGQRCGSSLISNFAPINLLFVLLQPDEERFAFSGKSKVAGRVLVQGLAKVSQELG